MRVTLPELRVPNRRLGRHIRHDPQSLRYLLPEAAAVSVLWPRIVPIFDQGDLGSCTGNALAGALGSDPIQQTLGGLVEDEALAVSIYSDAEKLDGGAGLPDEDDGSSGLSVAKVAKARGYISGYQHATTVAQAHAALQAGPFLVGSYWYSGMDDPTSEGIVKPTGTIRGGHEYLCRGYGAARDLWELDNSWSPGWGLNGSFFYDTPTFTKLLANYGDVTSLVPITQPAPSPQPSGYSTVQFTSDELATLDGWAARSISARKPSAAWRAARTRNSEATQ